MANIQARIHAHRRMAILACLMLGIQEIPGVQGYRHVRKARTLLTSFASMRQRIADAKANATPSAMHQQVTEANATPAATLQQVTDVTEANATPADTPQQVTDVTEAHATAAAVHQQVTAANATTLFATMRQSASDADVKLRQATDASVTTTEMALMLQHVNDDEATSTSAPTIAPKASQSLLENQPEIPRSSSSGPPKRSLWSRSSHSLSGRKNSGLKRPPSSMAVNRLLTFLSRDASFKTVKKHTKAAQVRKKVMFVGLGGGGDTVTAILAAKAHQKHAPQGEDKAIAMGAGNSYANLKKYLDTSTDASELATMKKKLGRKGLEEGPLHNYLQNRLEGVDPTARLEQQAVFRLKDIALAGGVAGQEARLRQEKSLIGQPYNSLWEESIIASAVGVDTYMAYTIGNVKGRDLGFDGKPITKDNAGEQHSLISKQFTAFVKQARVTDIVFVQIGGSSTDQEANIIQGTATISRAESMKFLCRQTNTRITYRLYGPGSGKVVTPQSWETEHTKWTHANRYEYGKQLVYQSQQLPDYLKTKFPFMGNELQARDNLNNALAKRELDTGEVTKQMVAAQAKGEEQLFFQTAKTLALQKGIIRGQERDDLLSEVFDLSRTKAIFENAVNIDTLREKMQVEEKKELLRLGLVARGMTREVLFNTQTEAWLDPEQLRIMARTYESEVPSFTRCDMSFLPAYTAAVTRVYGTHLTSWAHGPDSILVYTKQQDWKSFSKDLYPDMKTKEDFLEIRRLLRSYTIGKLEGEMITAKLIDRDTKNLVWNPDGSPFGNVFVRMQLPAGHAGYDADKFHNDVWQEKDPVSKQVREDFFQEYNFGRNRPENDACWNVVTDGTPGEATFRCNYDNKKAGNGVLWEKCRAEQPKCALGVGSMAKDHHFLFLEDNVAQYTRPGTKNTWEWFNVLTFGEISGLRSASIKLKDIKKAAELYTQLHKEQFGRFSKGAKYFLHVHGHNSVQSFHLHMLDIASMEKSPHYEKHMHKNLELDLAIEAIEDELADEEARYDNLRTWLSSRRS